MNELEPNKVPMILGTQYFFALLREDEETLELVAQQIVELPREDLFEFINYLCANLTQMFQGICEYNPKVKDVMLLVYENYKKQGEPIA
tara:strand:- start:159 stop:425 length:267 start_codon:yes stop_codon:yes gene_type:complete